MGIGLRTYAPTELPRVTRLGRLARETVTSHKDDARWLRHLPAGLFAIRLLVGVSSIAGAWALPAAASEKRLLVLLLGFLYVPYTVAVGVLERRLTGPVAKGAALAGDLLAVFLFHALIPATRYVALIGYLLIVTTHTYVGSKKVGLVIAAISASMTFLAQQMAPAGSRIDPYTLTMFCGALVAMVLLTNMMTEEQKRARQGLMELHRSLKVLSSASGTEEVLQQVTESVRSSLNALLAAVLLRDVDAPAPVAVMAIPPSSDIAEVNHHAFRAENSGPPAWAVSTGNSVVVDDIADDVRFESWRDMAKLIGFRSMISVPLKSGARVIGVLNVYFSKPGAVRDAEREIALAYADQAAEALIRAEVQEREKKAAHRLRELDQLKDEFMSRLSHELRTPLTVIVGYSETLLRNWGKLSEHDRVEFLKRVTGQSREMKRLVDQLLDFSEISKSKRNMHLEKIDLHSVFSRVLESVSETLASHQIHLAVAPGLSVQADRDAVERIVLNLFSNAAKFSPKGGGIRVTAVESEGQVEIAIHDQGVGIADNEKTKVFEPFYQAPGQQQSRMGTGTGLPIAKHYVELHGGRIWLESTKGVGTTFRFTLPSAR